ncbi:hypothetical protein LT337_13005 [Mycolicibacterium fortuitum]|nr:hypothetical protein LT337_13005 [Mycolicibacterium fortuitum]
MATHRVRWKIALITLTVLAAIIIVTRSADDDRSRHGFVQPPTSALPPLTTTPRLPAMPQPFAENSPFRTPIPADAEADPNSAAMISSVGWDDSAYVSTIEYGIPIYTANAGTPRYSVPCLITTWATVRSMGTGCRYPTTHYHSTAQTAQWWWLTRRTERYTNSGAPCVKNTAGQPNSLP